MAREPSSAVPSDSRRVLESIARNVRLRLAGEASAGLSAVPCVPRPALNDWRAVREPESPPTAGQAGRGTPSIENTPEVQAADTLRQELAAQVHVAAQTELFTLGSAEPENGVNRVEALARIAAEVAVCDRCPELLGRTNTVPGQGDPHAKLVFIGEGPGEEEDRQGLAFVGRAGELLTKMIEAIGMTRDQVFICNIIKCRPPSNRTPMPDEAANCTPYLMRQLEVLRPKVICALGGTATKYLLQTHDGITRVRGRFYPYRGTLLMPTFHPAYVLRNYTPDTRKKVYDDLLKVKAELDRPGFASA